MRIGAKWHRSHFVHGFRALRAVFAKQNPRSRFLHCRIIGRNLCTRRDPCHFGRKIAPGNTRSAFVRRGFASRCAPSTHPRHRIVLRRDGCGHRGRRGRSCGRRRGLADRLPCALRRRGAGDRQPQAHRGHLRRVRRMPGRGGCPPGHAPLELGRPRRRGRHLRTGPRGRARGGRGVRERGCLGAGRAVHRREPPRGPSVREQDRRTGLLAAGGGVARVGRQHDARARARLGRLRHARFHHRRRGGRGVRQGGEGARPGRAR